MRRAFVAIGFGVLGLVSLLAWSSIDAWLCGLFERLCVPRPGECGGGLDACGVTAQMVFDFCLYLLSPPLAFAGLGYALAARKSQLVAIVKSMIIAVLVHWFVTFVGVRVLYI